METSKKSQQTKAATTKKKKVQKKRISDYVCPEKMTLEEWQIALRRQMAQDETTGQTSLKIPVPDKQTVRNLLDIVGKLFG